MKLIRFSTGDIQGWGMLDGMEVGYLPYFEFDQQVPTPSRRVPVNDVRWLYAPVNLKRNVFCLGRNYAEHVKEGPGAPAGLPTKPIWFTKATTALNDPDADFVVDASLTEQLDYEVELAVVLKRGGRWISEDVALDYVFGYTVLNDFSARDVQNGRGGQWFLGKSFDGSCPIGPCLVTADEIGDPQNLNISLRVNGEERQRANTADMIFGIARSIADLSRYVTLQPGDVIATGTPAGVAMGMKPEPVWLKDGDVVEAEIDGIGVLKNRIVIVQSVAPEAVAPSAVTSDSDAEDDLPPVADSEPEGPTDEQVALTEGDTMPTEKPEENATRDAR